MSHHPWTDALLDRMRLTGDNEGDAAVSALYQDVLGSPGAFRRVNQLLFHLSFAREIDFSTLPPAVREFAEQSSRPPAWADPKLVKEGQEFFYVNGLGATVLLVCASLPECYVMRNGIQVLALTTYLRDRPGMRVLETSQMVRDVMIPGGLELGGKGILAAQKVRLLHAAVRHLILEAKDLDDDEDMGKIYAQQDWNPAWGHPICQEDMAYTLQTFAYVVLRGLEDLGVAVTERQKEAFIHCWNVAGHVLGIERELLPEPDGDPAYSRFEHAKLLYEKMRARQAGATKEGQEITAALVGLVERFIREHIEQTFLLKRVGGRKLVHVPRFLMRHLLGPETLELLGVTVPQAGLFDRALLRIALRLTKRGERDYQALARIGPVRQLSEALHVMLTERFSKLPRDHKLTYLPEHLRRSFDFAPLFEDEGKPGTADSRRPPAEAPRAPGPPPPLDH